MEHITLLIAITAIILSIVLSLALAYAGDCTDKKVKNLSKKVKNLSDELVKLQRNTPQ